MVFAVIIGQQFIDAGRGSAGLQQQIGFKIVIAKIFIDRTAVAAFIFLFNQVDRKEHIVLDGRIGGKVFYYASHYVVVVIVGNDHLADGIIIAKKFAGC